MRAPVNIPIANRTYAINSHGRNGLKPSVKIAMIAKAKPVRKKIGMNGPRTFAIEKTPRIVGTCRVATARCMRKAGPYVVATAVNMLRTCRKTKSRIGSLSCSMRRKLAGHLAKDRCVAVDVAFGGCG